MGTNQSTHKPMASVTVISGRSRTGATLTHGWLPLFEFARAFLFITLRMLLAETKRDVSIVDVRRKPHFICDWRRDELKALGKSLMDSCVNKKRGCNLQVRDHPILANEWICVECDWPNERKALVCKNAACCAVNAVVGDSTTALYAPYSFTPRLCSCFIPVYSHAFGVSTSSSSVPAKVRALLNSIFFHSAHGCTGSETFHSNQHRNSRNFTDSSRNWIGDHRLP